jgi:hypothetical protein
MSEAVRSKVERHATGLENAAKAMSADGIGLDHLRGHVVTLRRMAAAMRQDAAQGRLPHSYSDSIYASAAASQLPGQIVHAMSAAGLALAPDETISVESIDAVFADAGTDPGDRIAIKQALASAGRLTAS